MKNARKKLLDDEMNRTFSSPFLSALWLAFFSLRAQKKLRVTELWDCFFLCISSLVFFMNSKSENNATGYPGQALKMRTWNIKVSEEMFVAQKRKAEAETHNFPARSIIKIIEILTLLFAKKDAIKEG